MAERKKVQATDVLRDQFPKVGSSVPVQELVEKVVRMTGVKEASVLGHIWWCTSGGDPKITLERKTLKDGTKIVKRVKAKSKAKEKAQGGKEAK